MAFQFAVNQPVSNHLRDIVQPVDPLVCFFRFSFNTFFSGVEFNRQPADIFCGVCVYLVTVNQKCSSRFVPVPVEASQLLTVLSRLFLAFPLSVWCLCFVLLFSSVKNPSEYFYKYLYFLFVSKIIKAIKIYNIYYYVLRIEPRTSPIHNKCPTPELHFPTRYVLVL